MGVLREAPLCVAGTGYLLGEEGRLCRGIWDGSQQEPGGGEGSAMGLLPLIASLLAVPSCLYPLGPHLQGGQASRRLALRRMNVPVCVPPPPSLSTSSFSSSPFCYGMEASLRHGHFFRARLGPLVSSVCKVATEQKCASAARGPPWFWKVLWIS